MILAAGLCIGVGIAVAGWLIGSGLSYLGDAVNDSMVRLIKEMQHWSKV